MVSPKNKKHLLPKDTHWVENFFKKNLPSIANPHVFLSLIIPVCNCSELIGETLESIKRQSYLSLEIIIVDADSTDRTLETVNAYYPLITRVYTVEDFDLYDMINRGISLASGNYIAFSFPGTLYLSSHTFQSMAQKVLENENPELVYCGSILREGKKLPRQLNDPFDL
jgi:cellulose synthase/poly-beta-1,6-N-acetylglucosamine synthase-like glycosyltransferase